MSILTVTLNACVDKAFTVPGFAAGGIFRPERVVTTPGGKGINVARVYRTLGGEARATGFLGGTNGDLVARGLQAEGIPDAFVRIAGESRLCIKIMDPAGKIETELNENGPEISDRDVESLTECLRELLPAHEAVVISGSVPPGTPTDVYRRLIGMAQGEFGVKAILDTSGPALADGAAAEPFLLKPNVHELNALEIAGDGWAVSAAELRRRYGVPLAMITGGSRGAVVASADGVWETVPPPITVASAVGSGDSLTAAFLWAVLSGYNIPDALRLGTAAGAANALTEASGFCTHESILELVARTQVNKLA